MNFFTPGGTKRFFQRGTTPTELRPPPPRRKLPSLTTQQEVMSEAREREIEMAERTEPPPASGAVLELIATDVRRISRGLEDVKVRQTALEKKEQRSFEWIKFLGALSSSLPVIGMVWGEWIKLNPSVGATALGGWVTALFAVFQIKKMQSSGSGSKEA